MTLGFSVTLRVVPSLLLLIQYVSNNLSACSSARPSGKSRAAVLFKQNNAVERQIGMLPCYITLALRKTALSRSEMNAR
jgi:hypothetical protein